MGEQLKSLCRKNVLGEKESLGRYWECFLTRVPQLWEESDEQREGFGFSYSLQDAGFGTWSFV